MYRHNSSIPCLCEKYDMIIQLCSMYFVLYCEELDHLKFNPSTPPAQDPNFLWYVLLVNPVILTLLLLRRFG